ncbi:YheC/YheD family protein [Gorillibacterium massiliense]|uniref:YheC/YheD family endospore coat-associated protein n=1 Tax=Gorillibacterium massiliense TaxID=1280390 RepID=UPI0004ADE2EB|nr:YheC/YheD family protein [Gorillibacterium massiliense]
MTSDSRERAIVGVILGERFVKTIRVQKLAEANRVAETILYFFGTRDIDYEQKSISGMYYDTQDNAWRRKIFPLPQVLYVRGGPFAGVARVVSRFDDMGIKRINALWVFDKGELFQHLHTDPDVKPYLPFTVPIDNTSEAREYIRTLGDVYIKAREGRRGKQVMRVIKVKHKGYRYSYSILGNLVRDDARHFKQMNQVLEKFFGDRPILVQQGIDLVKVGDDRTVDLRAEVQRNQYGEIEIVAIPIRVGQENSPISTHGAAYPFSDYLPKLFPQYSESEIEDLKTRIYDFLRKVYKSVEERYGTFGEIGIDFGLDRNGQIWLIECNAQSAKVSVSKAYGPSIDERVYLNPLEYAKLLADS